MKNRFSPIYSNLLAGEKDYRSRLAGVLNTTAPSQEISMQTSGTPNVDVGAVPSVSSLANLKSVYGTQSQLRTSQAKSKIKGLPDYARSYNQYLRWRYPSRYGGGTSGYNVNYGNIGNDGSLVQPLTGIASLDISGDGWPG